MRKAKCNQGASVILNEDAGGQPSVLPPAVADPGAKVQAPPPPPRGEGVGPTPSIAARGGR
ncbi:MAG: hypothetical protein GY696_03655 [Gammaproteobacteria bacterium]|nr:hypothetical protein [Gammaproteobacteria bacterium]